MKELRCCGSVTGGASRCPSRILSCRLAKIPDACPCDPSVLPPQGTCTVREQGATTGLTKALLFVSPHILAVRRAPHPDTNPSGEPLSGQGLKWTITEEASSRLLSHVTNNQGRAHQIRDKAKIKYVRPQMWGLSL